MNYSSNVKIKRRFNLKLLVYDMLVARAGWATAGHGRLQTTCWVCSLFSSPIIRKLHLATATTKLEAIVIGQRHCTYLGIISL